MTTIHEAYQYLSKKFVDEVALNTLANKYCYHTLTIEDIKSNNVRHNNSIKTEANRRKSLQPARIGIATGGFPIDIKTKIRYYLIICCYLNSIR